MVLMPRYPGAIDPIEVIDWGVNSIVDILVFLSGKFGSGKILMKRLLDETELFRTDSKSNRKFTKMIYYLKSKGYISFEGESIRITDKTKMREVEKLIPKQSHKIIRLVSFDIPERLKENRNRFRRAIKRMGFVQIQKSLWASDHNLGGLVEIAAKEYGVEDYVAYFVSSNSSIDKHIKNLLASKK